MKYYYRGIRKTSKRQVLKTKYNSRSLHEFIYIPQIVVYVNWFKYRKYKFKDILNLINEVVLIQKSIKPFDIADIGMSFNEINEKIL